MALQTQKKTRESLSKRRNRRKQLRERLKSKQEQDPEFYEFKPGSGLELEMTTNGIV